MKSKGKLSSVFILVSIFALSASVSLSDRIQSLAYEEEIDYSALPNEVGDLLPGMKEPSDSEQKEKYQYFWKLKNIIGYLSYPEQNALLKALTPGKLEQNTPLFDKTIYNKEIQGIFDKQTEAISQYISDYEKKLGYGMGCLKNVANNYVFESDYNQEMQKKLYHSIDKIVQAQVQFNQCQAEFIDKIQEVLLQRRNHLLGLTKSDFNSIPSNKLFVNETDGRLPNIFGIKYTSDEIVSIIKSFVKFSACQIDFNNILGLKSIEAEIAISNMDKCRDPKNPNSNAGNSSNIIDNSLNYKNDKTIGINNGELIRGDQLTNNGYFLDKGYGYAVSSGKKREVSRFSEEGKELMKEIKEKFQDFSSIIADIENESSRLQPFSGLLQEFIFLYSSINESRDLVSTLIKGLKAEEESCCLDGSDSSQCLGNSNSCSSVTILETIKGLKLKKFISKKYSDFAVVYVEGERISDSDTEKYFDLILINGNVKKSVGMLNSRTIQSCFGVFTAGGSNDKDACRDVMTKKCGTSLDYKCKKSGFYDYVNVHPFYSFSFPDDCIDYLSENPSNIDKYGKTCFSWIEKYFIDGTMSLKPSSIIGYSLHANSKTNGKNPENYHGNVEDLIAETTGERYSSRESIILESSSSKAGDGSVQYIEMDRSNYLHLENSFGYQGVNIIILSILIFLF